MRTFLLRAALGSVIVFVVSPNYLNAQQYECRVGNLTYYSSMPCSNIPAPPVPTKEEVEQRKKALEPAQKALDEMLKVQSVTRAGVTYQEYERRFLDAKVALDAHLRPVTALLPLSVLKPLSEAASLYKEASDLWNMKISSKYDYINDQSYQDRLVARFPILVLARAKYRRLDITDVLSAIWQQASSELAAAERALERESR